MVGHDVSMQRPPRLRPRSTTKHVHLPHGGHMATQPPKDRNAEASLPLPTEGETSRDPTFIPAIRRPFSSLATMLYKTSIALLLGNRHDI